jgi:hypothetical protein
VHAQVISSYHHHHHHHHQTIYFTIAISKAPLRIHNFSVYQHVMHLAAIEAAFMYPYDCYQCHPQHCRPPHHHHEDTKKKKRKQNVATAAANDDDDNINAILFYQYYAVAPTVHDATTHYLSSIPS